MKALVTGGAGFIRDPRPGDVPATQADITKAKKVLDYGSTVTFDEGLECTVDWYLKYLERK